jgi:hypothetical protein
MVQTRGALHSALQPCRAVGFAEADYTHAGAINRCRYGAGRDAAPSGAGCLTPLREKSSRHASREPR